jgi:hypothetical protein
MAEHAEKQWHHEVLTPAQAQALRSTTRILVPTCRGFLAGGTGLALRFGHRRSRDLDWFTTEDFAHLEIAARMQDELGATITVAEPGTLTATCGGVAISLIRYRYAAQATDACDGTPIASLRTAADMKLLAVVNRGYKRDFIDIATLLRHGSRLPDLIRDAVADLPGLTQESCLRCLAYRDEAETQPDPEGIGPGDWREAQAAIDAGIRSWMQSPFAP